MNTYFETSALIKLLIAEEGTDDAARIWDASDLIATSRLTHPESRAALASARRAGRVSDSQLRVAKDALDDRFQGVEVIEITNEIARLAGDLAEKHRLRGYDAVHLASALTFAGDSVLVSWDRDLVEAARALGLSPAGLVD